MPIIRSDWPLKAKNSPHSVLTVEFYYKHELPFGISSAPGYFQEIMEGMTYDLEEVAVYLEDILIRGSNEEEHLKNLQLLLQHLQDKGLRCCWQIKCVFAQPPVEFGLYYIKEGILKGKRKVYAIAILDMPAPTNVSFLGSIQSYGKFIKDLSTLTEPLYCLLKKGVPWRWGNQEQQAFKCLKSISLYWYCTDTLQSTRANWHFLWCFRCWHWSSPFSPLQWWTECPITNASKTLSTTQHWYFILVTDHKPLLALFRPQKGTLTLAANRLACWSFTLSQYDYSIEYRKTLEHGNADALSRLPVGRDIQFERKQ